MEDPPPRGLEVNVGAASRSDFLMYVEKERILSETTVTIERMAPSCRWAARHPSLIIVFGDLTVPGAIDAAGGFTEYADRRDVIPNVATCPADLARMPRRPFAIPSGESAPVSRRSVHAPQHLVMYRTPAPGLPGAGTVTESAALARGPWRGRPGGGFRVGDQVIFGRMSTASSWCLRTNAPVTVNERPPWQHAACSGTGLHPSAAPSSFTPVISTRPKSLSGGRYHAARGGIRQR